MGETTISRVPTAKYLGLTLDEKLTFAQHIQHLQNDLIKLIRSLKIIKNYVPIKDKNKLYFAYIHSKIKYGIEIYGQAATVHLNKIQRLQNRALKTLHNKDYTTPTLKLHSDLNLLLIKDIYKHSIAQFVFRQKNNKLPEIFDNYFQSATHQHNTRQIEKMPTLRKRTEQGKNMLNYSGAKIWNSLPPKIRSVTSLYKLKRDSKLYYLSNY